jgi:hypothetical protein
MLLLLLIRFESLTQGLASPTMWGGCDQQPISGNWLNIGNMRQRKIGKRWSIEVVGRSNEERNKDRKRHWLSCMRESGIGNGYKDGALSMDKQDPEIVEESSKDSALKSYS